MVNHLLKLKTSLFLLLYFDYTSSMKAASVLESKFNSMKNEPYVIGPIKRLKYEDKIRLHKFLKALNDLKRAKESILHSEESTNEIRRNLNGNPNVQYNTDENFQKFLPEENKNQHKHEENSLSDHWAEHEHSHSQQVNADKHKMAC